MRMKTATIPLLLLLLILPFAVQATPSHITPLLFFTTTTTTLTLALALAPVLMMMTTMPSSAAAAAIPAPAPATPATTTPLTLTLALPPPPPPPPPRTKHPPPPSTHSTSNSTTTTTTTHPTHPTHHPRGARRFLFYCRGRANGAADGYGCGGPCSIYYEGDPLDDYSIVCPGTNCVDTDGSWKFMVCDVAYDCSISKNFNPGIDTQGRYIWNTPGTSYIYPGVN